ncbi:helix-turn-helix domain-containing protein [Spirillospora sp. NBC_01491]|uniref:helix-turn-helix domain-containing protein n=1 Tax=Spirillospora sp. NBC_01491 TaxID=2976007 RepID=UPI002E3092C7|nr:helix-turn-helix transcriptional regulator [Spirillospora sp. NBC_01491]
MNIAHHSPTVRGRRLARELRVVRENSGMSAERAAAALGWSRHKVNRIETARTRPSVKDVENAVDLYGASASVRTALVQLAREAAQRGWWAAFSDVLGSSYVGLEDEATTIRSRQVQTVPGLLQTPDYARALIQTAIPYDHAGAERRVQARLARQALLTRSVPPSLAAVVDEAVLRRLVGTPQIMHDQLRALLPQAARPTVKMRVLPFTRGTIGVEGSFVVLGFADELDPDVGYVESIGGSLFLESATQVARCNLTFERIWDAALPEEASADLITALMKEL